MERLTVVVPVNRHRQRVTDTEPIKGTARSIVNGVRHGLPANLVYRWFEGMGAKPNWAVLCQVQQQEYSKSGRRFGQVQIGKGLFRNGCVL